MPYLEAEEKKLYYESRGKGEPLIMIHGLALDSRIWRDLPDTLMKKYRVVTYDLRGHGRSWVPDSGYSYRDHLNDLKWLLTELGLSQVTVLGHSLGGAVAIKYALNAPANVEALVLLAPHVVGYTDYVNWPNVYRTARLIDIDQARISWETFRLFQGLKKGTPEKELFDRCVKEFPGKVWTDQQALRYVEESDLKILDRLEAPTLLLCGSNDHDFLPLAKIVNARLQRGTLYEIPECSHMIHLEQPEILLRELRGFLNL